MNRKCVARMTRAAVVGMCLAVVMSAAGVGGTEARAADAEPRIAPEAERVLRKAADHLRRLDSFRIAITEDSAHEADGLRERTAVEYEMSMRRPNQFAQLVRRGTDDGHTIVCDGQKVHVYYPFLHSYTVDDLPAELGGPAEGVLADVAGAVWLRAAHVLFADDPYEAFMEGVRAAEYLGVEEVDGVEHHRLRLHVPQVWLLEVEAEVEVAWDVWLAAGDRPVPRRAVPDMNAALEQMRRDLGAERVERMLGSNARMEVEYRYADWEPNAGFDAGHFTFDPPEGTHEIPSLRDLLVEPGGDDRPGAPG